MYGQGKSDSPVVSKKKPNNAATTPAAEVLEKRGLLEGNMLQSNRYRTQSRVRLQQTLERVRQVVSK